MFSRKIEYENLIEPFIRVHNVLWQLMSKVQDHFLVPYEVDEINFPKKAIFPMENIFRLIFLVLPSMADLR